MFVTYKVDQNLSVPDLQWDNLIENSDTATIFQTPEYLFTWWEVFVKNLDEIFIIKVFDGSKLIGIAPFRKQADRVTFLGTDRIGKGGDLVTDFGDIVIKTGREKEVWQTVFKALQEGGIREAILDYIRESSPSFGYLKQFGHKVEEMLDMATPDVAPKLALPKTYEEYLFVLDRKQRHELRRKTRRLEEENFKIESARDLKTDTKDFIRLHKASTLEKDHFMTSEMETFFQGIIERLGKKEMIDLVFMEISKMKVSATVSFLWKREYWLYNSGFDRNYDNLAVGFLLKALTIKKAMEMGYITYNFLRGGERYKHDLGGRDERLFRAVLKI